MAFVRWPVEDFKKLPEQRPQIRAVVAGAVTDEVQEDALGRKDAGVVGKQAKNQAHKKAFEVVAGVREAECRDLMQSFFKSRRERTEDPASNVSKDPR